MKLWHDFGVSALALTIVLMTMAGGSIYLLSQGKPEVALAWTTSMAALGKPFYDGVEAGVY